MMTNRPVGAMPPAPRLLGQTRPMAAAPTTWITPPPPNPGTLIDGSPAGPSVGANLYSLATSIWSFIRELWKKAHDAVVAHV